MALNKFMHPRNIYKTPPDFAKLAQSNEEFSSIAKTDVTGKVSIDFKDPKCLRVLTKCLLKSDFGLDVDIPEDRLVPTLPLRLNYILWIEDLLTSTERKGSIRGLDIGTGACAIYTLLAAVKNKWHMIGTETDQDSLLKAQENIERNNLQDLIQVLMNPTTSLMEFLFTDENVQTFDFCMCNPPFYSNLQELCESRSPARFPPKNGFTGSPQELITEGGELTFCRNMIKESQNHKDKVFIFTTMVGHKYNLKELALHLKADGINYTTTEFCQGRVTRWGLAWTYHKVDVCNLVPARDKPRKKSSPVVFLLPPIPDHPYNVEEVSKKIISILQHLQIKYNILNKRGHNLCLNIKAVENTWSNQRRKRRLMRQLEGSKPKQPKLEKCSEVLDPVSEQLHIKSQLCFVASKEVKNNKSIDKTSLKVENIGNTSKISESEMKLDSSLDSVYSSAESLCLQPSSSKEDQFLVHAFLKLMKKEDSILLEMDFLNGTAGKEGLYQIMQYIKNNWK